MKGKRVFTQAQIEAIRKLILQKMKADPTAQKSIRRKIRDLGFYYSDFSPDKEGYTVEDFDRLLKSGQIRIDGSKQKDDPSASDSSPIESQERKSLPDSQRDANLRTVPAILNQIRGNLFDPAVKVMRAYQIVLESMLSV